MGVAGHDLDIAFLYQLSRKPGDPASEPSRRMRRPYIVLTPIPYRNKGLRNGRKTRFLSNHVFAFY